MRFFEAEFAESAGERWELGLSPRLMAAGWFAAAACVPVIFFFLVFGSGIFLGGLASADFWWSLWFFAALPVSAAALLGFTFGCRIIDPLHNLSACRALLRGSLTALFSYVVFVIVWVFVATIMTDLSRMASLEDALGAMLWIFLFGLVFVGWLILSAGAVAGWLLHRISRNDPVRFLSAPRVGAQTALQWYAVAILLFITIAGVPVLLAKLAQK